MSAPVPAASLILVTEDASVLVGERSHALDFLGGFIAFPGGRQDPEDLELSEALGLPALLVCALRELHEESGLVTDGHQLSAHEGPFEAWLKGVTIDRARFMEAGRWVTPDYSPKRFDTTFFVLQLRAPPPAPVESAFQKEFEWLRFAPASQIHQLYVEQKVLMTPPVKTAIRALERGVQGMVGRMRSTPGAQGELYLDSEPVYGIRTLPLRTPTLPPATHTNTYLAGHERLMIFDPATYDSAERERLTTLLELIDLPVEAIVLTHHHPDHMGSAQWLSDRLNVPVLGHPKTAELLQGQVNVQGTLQEGDLLDLGVDDAGRPFSLRALFTPGHAPGHLCFMDTRPGNRAMIVGDMIAAIGSIIIDPSEGDMAEYLRQLRRLRQMEHSILLPAHGPPVLNGHKKLDQYIEHRLMREQKVLTALRSAGEGSAFDLLPQAYDDTPAALYPLAARACLAHLLKLVEDGAATQSGDKFSIA